MKKIILITLVVSLSFIWSKPNKRLLGKTVAIKQDPYSSEEIYKIKELYDAGNHSALDALIKIYQDKEQTYSIRILCLDMLAKIEENGTNPLIKDAIKHTLENTDFIELEYLKKSILILQNYKDPEATKSLVKGLANSENKIMDLRETIINAIGDIDELNSVLGVCISFCNDKSISNEIKNIQNDLFNIGGEISLNDSSKTLLKDDSLSLLDNRIEELNESLESLEEFILPGGDSFSSNLHLARAIARRSERSIVDLYIKDLNNNNIVKYLNRLSDYLFVLSRFYNKNNHIDENMWKK